MSSSNNSETKAFCYLCAGFVCGIIGFFRGFILRTKKKMIENIPTSTVRAVAVGLAEVKGIAQPFRETVKAPFSKAESVFYHYKIEEHRGKNSWSTVKEFATPGWFCLEDETGKILVNPVSAELHLAGDRNYRLGGWGGERNRQEFEQGLIELGISPQGLFGMDKQLRCTESYILPGDPVYILGTAAKNPLVENSATGSENLCLQKEKGSFFFISDKSEKDLLSSMGGKMYLYFYGGPALTVVCLYLLIELYVKRYFAGAF